MLREVHLIGEIQAGQKAFVTGDQDSHVKSRWKMSDVQKSFAAV